MKKRQLALISGILFSLLAVLGCSNGSDGGGSSSVEKGATVTFVCGKYGVSADGKSEYKETLPDGIKHSPMASPYIKDEYKQQVEFYYWHEKDKTDVVNHTKEITSDITLYATYRALPVGSVNVKPNEDSLFVSWQKVPESKYHVNITIGTETTSQTLSKSSILIEDVPADTECKISVYTISNDPDVADSEVVEGSGKTGITEDDILMLLYMDGDNNLNDPIYLDLNEAEYGLSKLYYKKIRVVALWDGWDFKAGNADELSSIFDEAPYDYDVHNNASTRLLELASDARPLYSDAGVSWSACQLSLETKDLTDSVDWIENGEADMSNYKTLVNYLKWAQDNYKAKKVVLQFSNHGGGPRSASGKKMDFGRRSMCWDESNGGNSFLKTSDVSKALAEAGYGTDNKLELIIEDVCLGGSLEEAYEFKDYAEYYLASPNNIPGMGFDYTELIGKLDYSGYVSTAISSYVGSYKYDYTMSDEAWNEFFADLGITADDVQEYNLGRDVSVLNPNCATITCVILSRVNLIKEAVDNLAEVILSSTEDDPSLKKHGNDYYVLNTSDGKYYLNGNTSTSGWSGDSDSLESVSVKEAIKYHAAYYGTPIFYTGNYGCLKDLGYMANVIYARYGTGADNKETELGKKADHLIYTLKNAMNGAWRDGYKKPTYYHDSNNVYIPESAGLGLTINCSCWYDRTASDGKIYRYEDYLDWYEKELAFGKDCTNWSALIKEWFETPKTN